MGRNATITNKTAVLQDVEFVIDLIGSEINGGFTRSGGWVIHHVGGRSCSCGGSCRWCRSCGESVRRRRSCGGYSRWSHGSFRWWCTGVSMRPRRIDGWVRRIRIHHGREMSSRWHGWPPGPLGPSLSRRTLLLRGLSPERLARDIFDFLGQAPDPVSEGSSLFACRIESALDCSGAAKIVTSRFGDKQGIAEGFFACLAEQGWVANFEILARRLAKGASVVLGILPELTRLGAPSLSLPEVIVAILETVRRRGGELVDNVTVQAWAQKDSQVDGKLFQRHRSRCRRSWRDAVGRSVYRQGELLRSILRHVWSRRILSPLGLCCRLTCRWLNVTSSRRRYGGPSHCSYR